MACREREEQKILTICKEKLHKRAASDIFVLTFDRMRRHEGAWYLERQPIFPGYVFLESDNERMLLKGLGEIEEFGRCGITFRQEDYLGRMNCEEEAFLKKLCGDKHHLEMSRGIIWKGSTRVTEGPLKGMEKRIRRIDRHKRIARVGMMLRPDCRYIPAGLEITEKVV